MLAEMQKCKFLIRSAKDEGGCEVLRESVTETGKWIFDMIRGRNGTGRTWIVLPMVMLV